MVRITDDLVACESQFKAAGIKLPHFDVENATRNGREQPRWLHIGPGNLFRALHAQMAQTLLDDGWMQAGLVVVGMMGAAEIDDVYGVSDNRHLIVIVGSDGSMDATLSASVANAIYAGQGAPGYAELMRVARQPSLQMVTVSITEKGYTTRAEDNRWAPGVAADIAAGPSGATSAMGIVAAMLHARWSAGDFPIAMVSTDNFSANGDRFKQAICDIVTAWLHDGLVESDFVHYVMDRGRVSFPYTMVDRITPNPSAEVAERLTAAGVEGMDLVRVSESTVMAPFANTEPTWYLVVEDDFPGGRPPLEHAGVLMVNRDTVNLSDEMKVTACLNPLHTALAVFGVPLRFDRIWREVGDADLLALVQRLGVGEMLPVCPDPGVISPRAFLDQVLHQRLPNPSLPDAPQRIAADTSQKMPVRFGVALRRMIDQGVDLATLQAIPLTLAGWLRYLMGLDDDGQPVVLSPDPRLGELTNRLSALELGVDNSALAASVGVPLLSEVLGVDLPATPLASSIVAYLTDLTRGVGAIRSTLHRFASEISETSHL